MPRESPFPGVDCLERYMREISAFFDDSTGEDEEECETRFKSIMNPNSRGFMMHIRTWMVRGRVCFSCLIKFPTRTQRASPDGGLFTGVRLTNREGQQRVFHSFSTEKLFLIEFGEG